MIIDIHQHITYKRYPQFSELASHGCFTTKELLEDMDKWGVEKSVVLPITNPENIDYFGVVGNQEAIAECQKHADRLIPFCNIDPRSILNNPKADFSGLMKLFKDLNCRGIGEVCANLPANSPLYKNLFYHAGEMNLPVLFHLASQKGGMYGMIDGAALSGLKEVLKEFPKTIFIGHGPSFWNAIDADITTSEKRNSYPGGPIVNNGPLWELAKTFSNLYCDFSAGSGYNALTRDPDVGIKFLKQFNDKVFYGTDMFFRKDTPPPHLTMMQDALTKNKIMQSEYDNIMYRNFERIFGK